MLTHLHYAFSPVFIPLCVWDDDRRLHYDPGLLGSTKAELAANAGDGVCVLLRARVCVYANLIRGIVGRQFANVSQNLNQILTNAAGVCGTFALFHLRRIPASPAHFKGHHTHPRKCLCDDSSRVPPSLYQPSIPPVLSCWYRENLNETACWKT